MGTANRPRRRHRPRTFSEKFWENDHGQVVVWQKPNKLLYTWAICTFINLYVPLGWAVTLLGIVGLIALIAWAVMEIYSGVNYFRRLVGALVILILIFSRALI